MSPMQAETNVRFALVSSDSAPTLINPHKYKASSFASIEQAAHTYLTEQKSGIALSGAAISVAAPSAAMPSI